MCVKELVENFQLSGRKRNNVSEQQLGAFLQFDLQVVRSVLGQNIGFYFVEYIGKVKILFRNGRCILQSFQNRRCGCPSKYLGVYRSDENGFCARILADSVKCSGANESNIDVIIL